MATEASKVSRGGSRSKTEAGAIACRIRHGNDQRRIEDQMRQSPDHFRRLLHACPLPIGITTAHEGRFLEVNQAFLDLTGFKPAEVLGRAATELRLWVDPADRDLLRRRMRTSGSVRQHQTMLRTKCGRSYHALVTIERLLFEDQDCWLVISTDVTEKRGLELQASRTQRMENTWALARSIAHDLNNILTPVLTAGELLQERTSDPQTLQLLDVLRTNALRGAQLVQQVLSLARGGGDRLPVHRPCPIHQGHMSDTDPQGSHTTEVVQRLEGRQQGILLVDDEPTMLELLRSILESFNFQVWTAHDGAEALLLYYKHAVQIRVVVTDFAMPHMNGPELIAHIKQFHPPVRVMCTTGIDAVAQDKLFPAADRFLPKPFSLGCFIGLLKELLEEPA